MPSYGVMLVLWTSVMCLLPMGTRIAVLMMVFGITCVLPVLCIGLLHHFGIISDKLLDKQHERLYPYAFAVLCYLGATSYLHHIHAPQWFIMFMVGGCVACFISLVVNLFWKISAHMAGIGGIVALLYQIHVQGLSAFNLFWLLCFTILLAGMLGTSRLALKRHTLLQVLFGFANGYASVTLMMKLFG
ncbi:MAG: hypothetical protein IKR25_07255 [Muribaculaceae bacterium]|nr:hypothetical protein [Muribaculaceae bacterium]